MEPHSLCQSLSWCICDCSCIEFIVIAVYWLSPYCKRAHDNQFKSWRASWLTSSKSFVLLNEELSWDRMVLFFHLFSESSPLPESLGRKLWIANSASGPPDFQTFWLCRKHDTTSSRILVADNLFQDLLSPISRGNSLWILSFFIYIHMCIWPTQTNNTYLPMHNPFYWFYFLGTTVTD